MASTEQDNPLFSHVGQQIETIRKRLSVQQQVEFVFHPWKEFPNLSINGFKFPSVAQATIPRLTPIPIVSYPSVMYDSRLSNKLFKYVPVAVNFQQDIQGSLLDLINKFGKYGLVHLKSMSTDIDNMNDSIKAFEFVASPMRGVPMQEYVQYLGGVSPVQDQFTLKSKREEIEADAQQRLKDSFDDLPSRVYNIASKLIREMLVGVTRAHSKALMPPTGVLPASITSINNKRKFKFDAADEWVLSNFPAFDASSRTTSNTQQTSDEAVERIAQVFETIAGKMGGATAGLDLDDLASRVAQQMGATQTEENTGSQNGSTPESAPKVVEEEKQAEKAEEEQIEVAENRQDLDTSLESLFDGEEAPPPFSDSEKVEPEVFEDEDEPEDEPDDEDEYQAKTCTGVTKAGKPCGSLAMSGEDFCYAHKSQGE